MCAKSSKVVQAAMKAGYIVDMSVKPFLVCPACKHKSVIKFLKDPKRNSKKLPGKRHIEACFRCAHRKAYDKRPASKKNK